MSVEAEGMAPDGTFSFHLDDNTTLSYAWSGMKTVNMHEAKTHLSRLVEDVLQTGEVYVICRGGAPVAELRSIPKQKDPLQLDPALSVVLHEDPAQPLEADDWPEAFSR